MRKLALAASAVLRAFAAPHVRAEDPPPADAAKPSPEWSLEELAYEVTASRDGKWVACRESRRVRLFPAAGGDPVALELGKDERVGMYFAFSPDSKYVCVAGTASAAVVKGLPEDKTQTVYLYSVADPKRTRKVELALKAEGLSSEVKKLIEPRLRSMKMLTGEVRDFIPFAGSRVLFDRGELGLTLWDLGSEAKFAAPPALDSSLRCGLTDDGARCVLLTGKAMEIRDVKTNRVLQTIPTPDYSGSGVSALYPRFTRDGTCVLVQREPRDPKKERGEDDRDECHLDCWSLTESKRLWECFVGTAKYAHVPLVAAAHVAVQLDDRVVVRDLKDGANVDVPLPSLGISSVCVAGEGDAMWVVDTERPLKRVPLPAPAAK